MKSLALPKIQRRGVQRLTTPDISAPVRMAQAEAAKFSAIGSSALAIGGLAKGFIDRRNKQQVRDATLAVHKADTEFRVANEGAEEFDVMAVEDENFIGIADGLGYEDAEVPIPAHQVYADWRKKNYEDAIEKAASGISNDTMKNDFLQAHDMKGSSQYANDFVASTKKQIQYHAKKTMASVDNAILNRDFTTARLEVSTSDMSSTAKAAATKDINKREQFDYFNETLEKRGVATMQNALKQLIENDPKVTSELEAKEQKVIANQLRTAIGTEKNAVRAGVDAQLKLNSEDLKNQVEDTWGNKNVDLQAMEKNMKSLAGKDPVLVRKAEWTLNNQPLVGSILRSSPEDQAIAYEYAKANTGGDMEKSYLVDKLGKQIDEGNRARQTDAMKWANDTGFIVMEPVDFSSPQAMNEGLTKRLKQVVSIQDNYNAFTGFFTDAEMSTLGNRIENASIEEQLGIFGGISQSLGENAPALYEQLKKNGVAGTAALAGQLVARGPEYRATAENILKGAELRKTDTITQLAVKEADLDPVVLEKFGMMFAGNPQHQSLMADAFKDVWAVTRDTDMAFKQLVGDTIDMDGSTIQAPAPGVGHYGYTRHLKDIVPEWWAGDNMKAYGYSPAQIKKGVLDGSLKQIGVGENVNNLMAPNGSIVTRPDGVTALPFSIDMSEPTTSAKYQEVNKEYKAKLAAEKKKKQTEKAVRFQKAWSEVGTIKGGPT